MWPLRNRKEKLQSNAGRESIVLSREGEYWHFLTNKWDLIQNDVSIWMGFTLVLWWLGSGTRWPTHLTLPQDPGRDLDSLGKKKSGREYFRHWRASSRGYAPQFAQTRSSGDIDSGDWGASPFSWSRLKKRYGLTYADRGSGWGWLHLE